MTQEIKETFGERAYARWSSTKEYPRATNIKDYSIISAIIAAVHVLPITVALLISHAHENKAAQLQPIQIDQAPATP